jgi:hypothetical protein
MATRIYLPASAETAGVQFSESTEWEDVTILQRAVARTTPRSDAMATVSFADANNANRDVCFRQYVSHPLTVGQIITGAQAIKAQCRVAERIAGNNLFFVVGIRVLNRISATVSKVILAPTRDNVEAATTLTNRQLTATSQAGSYTTIAGDHLVIETGMGGDPANSGGADHDSDMRLGDAAGSFLPENDTATTDNSPWVELTTTLTFAPYAATAADLVAGGAESASLMAFVPAESSTYTADAPLLAGGAELAAEMISGRHPVDRITQPKSGIFSRRYGSFADKPYSPPTFTINTCGLVAGGAECAAESQFIFVGTFEATEADVTAIGMGLSASGLFAAEHPVARLTQPTFGIFGKRYGSFVRGGSEASLVAGGAEFAAEMTFAASEHPVSRLTQPKFGLFGQRYGSFGGRLGFSNASADLVSGGAEFAAVALAQPRVGTASLLTGGAASASAMLFIQSLTAEAGLIHGGAEFAAGMNFAPLGSNPPPTGTARKKYVLMAG